MLSDSLQRHRSEFAWHILVPFLVISILIIIAAVLFIPWGTNTSQTVRDISIIWLLVPFIILAVLIIVIFGLIIYGFAKLTPIIPKFTRHAQQVTAFIAAGTRKVTNVIQIPVIWLQIAGEKIKSLLKRQ
jgi:hypothetical protein